MTTTLLRELEEQLRGEAHAGMLGRMVAMQLAIWFVGAGRNATPGQSVQHFRTLAKVNPGSAELWTSCAETIQLALSMPNEFTRATDGRAYVQEPAA